jgi:two-component system chemotaxis response regulator CheB
VVVGASAGGVEALRAFVGGLPPDLDAAVCVVLHIPRSGTSALPKILTRSGPLPAVHATDGMALESGHIYVAPANCHLLVSDGRLCLSRGPVENGHRPAVDPLFRSAARAWGGKVVGVVLSGARDDGTSGLATVVDFGGAALVQEPGEALYPSMPRSAAEHAQKARALPAAKLGLAVADLVASTDYREPAPQRSDALLNAEAAMAQMEPVTADKIGRPAGLGCPTCHGALFELDGEPSPRFRCRVGHAWSPESLIEEQAESLEGALWIALRSLEEKASLSQRMAASARRRGNASAAERYTDVGFGAERAGRVVRDLITKIGGMDGVDDGDPVQ